MSKENNYSDLTRLDILLGELGGMVFRKHYEEKPLNVAMKYLK